MDSYFLNSVCNLFNIFSYFIRSVIQLFFLSFCIFSTPNKFVSWKSYSDRIENNFIKKLNSFINGDILTQSLNIYFRFCSLQVLSVDSCFKSIEPNTQSEKKSSNSIILNLICGMVTLSEVDQWSREHSEKEGEKLVYRQHQTCYQILYKLDQKFSQKKYYLYLNQLNIVFIIVRVVIMKDGRQLISQKKRESTDIICLILFIIFTIMILIAGVYSYIQGSTSKYSAPYDSDGKGCGVDYPEYNFIYFPSPQVDSLWVTTCVKTCPGDSDQTVNCQPNSAVTNCSENNSADNTKAFHIYETETFRNSICLPTAETIKDRVLGAISAHFVEQMFGSVLKDWSLLLLMVPIAALVSIFALVLIRVIAGYVIYFFYVFIIVALIGFGVYLDLPVENKSEKTFVLKQNQPLAIGISIICYLLAIVLLFLFISYREKIKQTVNYIDKSNEFFRNNYSIIILPIILTGCSILFLFFWLFLTLSFYSMATPLQELNQLPYQHFKLPGLIVAALIIGLFYLIWSIFFLIHTGKCIVSGTLTSWKFNRKDPYLNASKVFLTSHIGSACLSSFLTALFGLFKFEVDDADCAEKQENENKCTSFFSRCYGCLCCCCVNFIFPCFHRAAFAYLNLSGLHYCQSSFQVLELIKGQKVLWGVVALLYGVFSDLIPLIIAVGNMLLANYFIDSIENYHNSTSNRILVLSVVALVTYAVSQFFLTIYSQAMQSSFVLEQFYKRMPNKQKYPLRIEEQSSKKEIVRFQPLSPRASNQQK